jgi:hypothetical protein
VLMHYDFKNPKLVKYFNIDYISDKCYNTSLTGLLMTAVITTLYPHIKTKLDKADKVQVKSTEYRSRGYSARGRV